MWCQLVFQNWFQFGQTCIPKPVWAVHRLFCGYVRMNQSFPGSFENWDLMSEIMPCFTNLLIDYNYAWEMFRIVLTSDTPTVCRTRVTFTHTLSTVVFPSTHVIPTTFTLISGVLWASKSMNRATASSFPASVSTNTIFSSGWVYII